MPIMTTAEATVAALIAHGLDTIYALPGVHNDPFFDALFKASDRIRTVHTRHEQGASLMALGAALARRGGPKLRPQPDRGARPRAALALGVHHATQGARLRRAAEPLRRC